MFFSILLWYHCICQVRFHTISAHMIENDLRRKTGLYITRCYFWDYRTNKFNYHHLYTSDRLQGRMRFLCCRICSKSKKPAVYESTLVEQNSTLGEKFNIRDGPDGHKTMTQRPRKMSKASVLSKDFHSEWTDEYASSSSDSVISSDRNC